MRRKNSNLSTIVCQIDLSNAYNTVNLKVLERRLVEEGIWCSQKLELWKYIFSRSQTWIEGHIVQEKYGVPQGSLLSPFLFNVYLHPILVEINQIEGVKLYAYADDMIIVAESMDKMKEALMELLAFCKVNFLKVNPSKSELLVICGNFKRTSVAGISFKENAKYLGVRYNKQVDVKRALNEFKPKSNFIFSRLFRLLKKSDCRSRYNLWQIFVLPLIRMTISMIGVAESHRCQEQM